MLETLCLSSAHRNDVALLVIFVDIIAGFSPCWQPLHLRITAARASLPTENQSRRTSPAAAPTLSHRPCTFLQQLRSALEPALAFARVRRACCSCLNSCTPLETCASGVPQAVARTCVPAAVAHSIAPSLRTLAFTAIDDCKQHELALLNPSPSSPSSRLPAHHRTVSSTQPTLVTRVLLFLNRTAYYYSPRPTAVQSFYVLRPTSNDSHRPSAHTIGPRARHTLSWPAPRVS